MTINQKNCGDSRMVKTLIEQVSGLQEDVALLDNQIDDLSGVKANKADIAEEVITRNLTANTATVGEGTVSNLHSSEVDTNRLHATETLTNSLEVNESANIANLTANNATITGAETTNLTATRVVALEKVEVREPGVGVQANVVLDKDKVKATNVEANKVVASVGEVTNVKSGNTVTDNLKVTERTTVKDLDITGEITGLNNVDIDAKSIVTPIIEADEVITGGIYTSSDNKLHPTPSLDNNDYYIITLPTFTGNIVLNWVGSRGNTLWSANVTGSGVNYAISWSTVSGNTIVVTNLYQYNKHLYIKTNVNGDLVYSYHTTEKLGEIGIGFNGVAGWTNPQSLDDLTDERHNYKCTELDGQVSFGDLYVPNLNVRLENIETETERLQASIETETKRATNAETSLQASIEAETERAIADESNLKANIKAETERATTAESSLQASIETETERATNAETSLQASIGEETRRATTVEGTLQASIETETRRATTVEGTLQASIEAETERATTVEGTKQDNLVSGTNIKTVNGHSLLGSGDLEINTIPTGGTEGQVLTSNGDGTTGWKTLKSSFVPPIGMVIELEGSLNPNNLFTGDWIEI